MALGNFNYTFNWGATTELSPDKVLYDWSFSYSGNPGITKDRYDHDEDDFDGRYYAGAYGGMSITHWVYDNEENKYTSKNNENVGIHIIIFPNDENSYKAYIIVNAGLNDTGNEDIRWYGYINGNLVSRSSALDDYLYTRWNTDVNYGVYNLGTFKYNEVPTIQGVKGSFTFKFGFIQTHWGTNFPSGAKINASDIPYQANFTVPAILKAPVITEIMQNPLSTFIGEGQTTNIHFTASSVPVSSDVVWTAKVGPVGLNSRMSNTINVTTGNNMCTLPALTVSDMRVPSGGSKTESTYVTLEPTLSSAASNVAVKMYNNTFVAASNLSREEFKLNAYYRTSALTQPTTFTYLYSAQSFHYYLKTQVESKYGTLTGDMHCNVNINAVPNGYDEYDLQLTIRDNTDGNVKVGADYYTFYAYINGTKVKASTGSNDVTVSLGRHKFNDLGDYGHATRGKFTVSLGQFYATKSSPTKPDTLQGSAVLVTMTPLLSIPKFTINQSVTPYQMGQSNPGTLNITCEDCTPEDSAYAYAPVWTYSLYNVITSKTKTLNGDFSLTLPTLANTLEEYLVNNTSNSSPLRRYLKFDTSKFTFSPLGSSAAAVQNTWAVYTPSGWMAYSSVVNGYTIPVTLDVNMDVNNGPRISTQTVTKISDHPHTELLLINRQDKLKVDYTYTKDASWVDCTGITLVFGDQVVSGTFAAGGVVGPFGILPYTEGVAFKVYGYLNDNLGRHGPQIQLTVKEDGSTITNLYAYNYINPKLTMEGYRANSAGNVDEENGTYAKATYHWNTTTLRTYKPTISIKLIKDVDQSTVSTQAPTLSATVGQGTATFSGLTLDNSYVVTATVTDAIGQTATYQFFIPSGKVFMDFKAGGKGMGIGMRAENDNQLDIGWNTVVHGTINVTGLLINGVAVTDGNNTKF